MALITQSQVVTQTEIISPMTARVYLEKNKCNRNISHAHRDKLARAMIAGEFRHTHQGIAFDINGDLIDGQHRLSAVIESNTSQVFQVTRNVPIESRSAVDNQSRPRSIHDALIMEGHQLATKQAVAVSRMWMYLLSQRSPAAHEIRSFLNEHTTAIEFACNTAAGHSVLKHACIMTMLAVAYEAGYGDEVVGWSEVIRTGIAPQQWQTSATRFRDWWMISKHTGGGSMRVEICQRAYTSMFAWVERRPLSKLYAKQTIEWLGQLGSI